MGKTTTKKPDTAATASHKLSIYFYESTEPLVVRFGFLKQKIMGDRGDRGEEMDPHIIISPRRPYHSLPLVVLVLPLPLFQVSQAKIIKKLGVS